MPGNTSAHNGGLLGPHIESCRGYANDPQIRHHGASGGLVTAALIHALETGRIDGALVTRRDHSAFEQFIARTKNEILSAQGSKYCPIRREKLPKKGKYAVVDLPCKVRTGANVALSFGLFCSGEPSYDATRFLLKHFEVDGFLPKVTYRGDGFPGDAMIETEAGDFTIPFYDYYHNGFGQYFHPYRCKMCADPTAERADLSFGDAWLPDVVENDKEGTSIVVARTKKGHDFLLELIEEGIMTLNYVSEEKVIESQGGYGLVYRKGDKTELRSRLITMANRIGMGLAARERLWELMVAYVHLLKQAEKVVSPRKLV